MLRRADLQGIRAFAVAMVIVYHLDARLLPGGFIGVDVFFVLSGFFITQVIYNELARSGSMNVIGFWTRRMKRLLPNALLTLAAVLVASWLLMPAYRWGTIAWDVGSAAVFLSNFHFASSAVDYFRFDDPPGPVLHFWSLSIEEQFYAALPIILVAVAALRQRLHASVNVTLAAIAVLSFAASLVIMRTDQTAAFFHTEARVWQLAVGGLLGVNFAVRRRIPAQIRGALAWAGAAAIAYATIFFNDMLAYPGFYALLPTFGALALILGLDENRTAQPLNALLSLPVLGWIGDRSYSLYLWHWPIIVFAQMRGPLGLTGMAMTLVAIVIVSSLAFRLVERPIHYSDTRHWKFLTIPGLAAAAIGALCLMAAALPAMPQPGRSLERTEAIARASKDFTAVYADRCHLRYEELESKECPYGVKGAAKKVVLFGDSHAAQWFGPLEKAAKDEGWELRAWTKTTCPWADITIWYQPRKAVYSECTTWREETLSRIVALKPDLVVLAELADYSGRLYDGEVLKGSAIQPAWERAMLKTIDRLEAAGIRVAMIHDTPRLYKTYRDCLATSDADCGRERKEATETADNVASFIRDTRPEVTILDFNDRICDPDRCPAIRNGQILYQDSHHLTATYLEGFSPDFARLMESGE
ncbi:MAG: acyltransferase [Rhizobiaceae bacterium]|nr:acyltransferase [Rhizobiaceae bacterium]